MEWKLIVARFVLERDFYPLTIPDLACQLLQEGYDTQNLRLLAGETRPAEAALKEPFALVLTEIGFLPMAPETAAQLLACEVAREISAGRVTPLNGISRIWSIMEAVPSVRHRPVFCDITKTEMNMWRYWPYHEDEYISQVISYAQLLLNAYNTETANQQMDGTR